MSDVPKTTYWKACRPDGTDFHTGRVDYAAALESGRRVRARTPARGAYECCTEDVLHAGVAPTDVWSGSRWPLRLFEVTGRPVAREGRKRGFRSLRVLREIPAHLAFGPQGEHVVAVIDRAGRITFDEARRLGAAWANAGDAARDAALAAAWVAAGDAAAAMDAAWRAARDAAMDAACTLVVRDLIGHHGFTQAHYDTLTGPWRRVIGPVHPDDGDLQVKR